MNSVKNLLSHPLVKVGLGGALIAFLALLPMLSLEIPGVFPGPTYTPGKAAASCVQHAYRRARTQLPPDLRRCRPAVVGHALYFAIGAYGLGIALRHFGLELLPAIIVTFVAGLFVAAAVGSVKPFSG